MAAMCIKRIKGGRWRVAVPGAPIEYADTFEIAAALASFWKARIAFDQSRQEGTAAVGFERPGPSPGLG